MPFNEFSGPTRAGETLVRIEERSSPCSIRVRNAVVFGVDVDDGLEAEPPGHLGDCVFELVSRDVEARQ